MKKKQLLYIIGGVVLAFIVLFLIIHLVLSSVRNSSGSSGYSNPPARLVQVMASSPGSGISYEGLGLQIPNDHFQAQL